MEWSNTVACDFTKCQKKKNESLTLTGFSEFKNVLVVIYLLFIYMRFRVTRSRVSKTNFELQIPSNLFSSARISGTHYHVQL